MKHDLIVIKNEKHYPVGDEDLYPDRPDYYEGEYDDEDGYGDLAFGSYEDFGDTD
jgi:hypothetical protein